MKLRDWQRCRLDELRKCRFRRSRYVDQVTLIVYAFPCDVDSAAFDWIECSVLQSWERLGSLKTVIVVHKCFDKVRRFAAVYHDWVDVQVEPSLVPGKIETMSADCNGQMHARFDTPYCLVIQDDGFPLRDSLDDFLGRYDFIGAPYVRISWWRNLICRSLGMWVSNGGFSLRSKRICEAAAEWWERKYAAMHPSPLTIDDLYYTKTLPLRHPSFRFKYRIAPNWAAIRFSYDALVNQPIREPPLGFHRDISFTELAEKKWRD